MLHAYTICSWKSPYEIHLQQSGPWHELSEPRNNSKVSMVPMMLSPQQRRGNGGRKKKQDSNVNNHFDNTRHPCINPFETSTEYLQLKTSCPSVPRRKRPSNFPNLDNQ